MTTEVPAHRNPSRDALPSGSLAAPTPAPADLTIAPPVAEEVSNKSTTTTGHLGTPGTEIASFSDLSQDADDGEGRVTLADKGGTAEDEPEDGRVIKQVTDTTLAEEEAWKPPVSRDGIGPCNPTINCFQS